MNTVTPPRVVPSPRAASSLFDVIRDFRTDVTTLIRQEIQLAKAEVSEKVSHAGRNASYVAVGGFVALLALMFLLMSIAALLSVLYQKLGLDKGFADVAGFATLGLIIGIAGYGLIKKGLNAFSKESLSPEKTIESLKGETGVSLKKELQQAEKEGKKAAKQAEEHVSSAVLKNRIDWTKDRLDDEVAAIKERLTPAYAISVAKAKVQERPVPYIVAAAITGLMAIGMVKHKFVARKKRALETALAKARRRN